MIIKLIIIYYIMGLITIKNKIYSTSDSLDSFRQFLISSEMISPGKMITDKELSVVLSVVKSLVNHIITNNN